MSAASKVVCWFVTTIPLALVGHEMKKKNNETHTYPRVGYKHRKYTVFGVFVDNTRGYFTSCEAMRAMRKMSPRIIDQNDKLEVYYSTPFCFCTCFVLLQQKPVKPELYGVIRWHIVRDVLISYTAK